MRRKAKGRKGVRGVMVIEWKFGNAEMTLSSLGGVGDIYIFVCVCAYIYVQL